MNKKDRLILGGLITAFTVSALWAYATGDIQKLLRHKTPEERASAQQRALDHILGSDQAFDSSADNVTTTAYSGQDNVSWKTLSHATFTLGNHKSAYPTVNYADEVQALDTHEITITGYIFPLESSVKQTHFLLSAYPPSCPYCLPGGPTEMIEVIDADPIAFTYDPVTVHGTFELLRGDALKEGLFYRMLHAHLPH